MLDPSAALYGKGTIRRKSKVAPFLGCLVVSGFVHSIHSEKQKRKYLKMYLCKSIMVKSLRTQSKRGRRRFFLY